MFDKVAYRKNREQGLRGTPDLRPVPTIALWTEEDFKKRKCDKKDIGTGRISRVEMRMTRQGLTANPRRFRRQKFVSKHYMPDREILVGIKNGKPVTDIVKDETGKKHTAKGVRRPVKKFEHPKPLHDPTMTSKDRMFNRRAVRGL